MLTPVYDSDITTTHKFEQKIEEARRQYKNRETIVCNTKEELHEDWIFKGCDKTTPKYKKSNLVLYKKLVSLLEEIMAPVQGPDTRNL